MATLTSPGVSVSVSDESAYAAPGGGTIPFIMVATGQDKTDPTGSASDSIAPYTKSAKANTPLLVTSQRELTQNFGDIFFRKSGSTPIVGDETSEYGMLAAYSFLGQGGSAYISRANINTTQLIPTTTTPTATYATANSMWIDTDASEYGINKWNATSSAWEKQTPTIEVNATATDAHSLGASGYSITTSIVNGNFLVVVHLDQDGNASLEYFYGVGGAWEELDSDGTLSSGETVTWAAHYSAPSTPGAGDVWIKTTSPGNGLDLKIYKHSGTGSWTLTSLQGVTSALGAGMSATIGDFIPQDGSSATALTSSTAVAGNFLADIDVNTKALIILQQVSAVGGVSNLDALTTKSAQNAEPTGTAASGTHWFDDSLTSLDVYKVNGSNYTTIVPTYATTAPTGPSAGDLWIDTTSCGYGLTNERAYPKIYQRNAGNSAWVLHSNADQSTSNGVLFADITDTAADATDGGNATEITGAPNAAIYPTGMVVINMAQSKNTVRTWNGTAWRNGASNHADGSGAFGRYAQRKVVATAMQSCASDTDNLDASLNYTLIAAPGYPELADEMITMNNNRGNTAFVIIDSPLRKSPTDIVTWIGGAGATENGEDALVTKSTYSATYYPALKATEPTEGATVVTYPSHSVLYQIATSDAVSYQWFAPAGLNRGVISNASGVGYVDGENEFKATALTNSQRDSLYSAKMNPIANFPDSGITIFGQKSLHSTTSALDRVNVARLVAYLRERFDVLARPFLFEPNDETTRDRAGLMFTNFLSDIQAKRGLSDFAVVCDSSNNTAARIDKNELYIDVAIAPAKSIEFIYIPIRIVNTGQLA